MRADKGSLCIILGGGGHAKVLIDSLQVSGIAVPYAILDVDRLRWEKDLLNVPILGGDDLLPEMVSRGVNCFVVGLGSTGDNRHRRRLFELGLAHGMNALTVIHPTAVCSTWATVEAGSQLFAGCIVNAGAKIGANVIVNSGAIIEHDCVLGDHVHIATGACLASTVKVETGGHIGAGATVRECIIIGEGSIVGAGAVVVKDVPPHTIVVGVPARPLQKAQPKSETLIPTGP